MKTRTFLGSHYRFVVEHAEQEFHIDTRRPVIGDRAFVYIPPKAVRVFPRSTTVSPIVKENAHV